MTDQPSRRSSRAIPTGDRLDQPREQRAMFLPRVTLSEEAFGVLSEKFARFMGTPQFLIGMTVFVAVWIAWNTLAPESFVFDEFPFIFLTLMLSLQASYAAPLILLAQNRQDERDRAQAERDRELNFRTQSEAEFLARELAAVRLTLSDVATVEELQDAIGALSESLTEAVGRIESKLDQQLRGGTTTP